MDKQACSPSEVSDREVDTSGTSYVGVFRNVIRSQGPVNFNIRVLGQGNANVYYGELSEEEFRNTLRDEQQAAAPEERVPAARSTVSTLANASGQAAPTVKEPSTLPSASRQAAVSKEKEVQQGDEARTGRHFLGGDAVGGVNQEEMRQRRVLALQQRNPDQHVAVQASTGRPELLGGPREAKRETHHRSGPNHPQTVAPLYPPKAQDSFANLPGPALPTPPQSQTSQHRGTGSLGGSRTSAAPRAGDAGGRNGAELAEAAAGGDQVQTSVAGGSAAGKQDASTGVSKAAVLTVSEPAPGGTKGKSVVEASVSGAATSKGQGTEDQPLGLNRLALSTIEANVPSAGVAEVETSLSREGIPQRRAGTPTGGQDGGTLSGGEARSGQSAAVGKRVRGHEEAQDDRERKRQQTEAMIKDYRRKLDELYASLAADQVLQHAPAPVPEVPPPRPVTNDAPELPPVSSSAPAKDAPALPVSANPPQSPSPPRAAASEQQWGAGFTPVAFHPPEEKTFEGGSAEKTAKRTPGSGKKAKGRSAADPDKLGREALRGAVEKSPLAGPGATAGGHVTPSADQERGGRSTQGLETREEDELVRQTQANLKLGGTLASADTTPERRALFPTKPANPTPPSVASQALPPSPRTSTFWEDRRALRRYRRPAGRELTGGSLGASDSSDTPTLLGGIPQRTPLSHALQPADNENRERSVKPPPRSAVPGAGSDASVGKRAPGVLSEESDGRALAPPVSSGAAMGDRGLRERMAGAQRLSGAVGKTASDAQLSPTSGVHEALRAVAAYGESDVDSEEEDEGASLGNGDDDGGQRRETGRARWSAPAPLDLGGREGSGIPSEQGADGDSEGSFGSGFDKLALAFADVLRAEPSLVTQDKGLEEKEATFEADDVAESRQKVGGVSPNGNAEAEGDGQAEQDGAADSDMELVEMEPNHIRIVRKHSEGSEGAVAAVGMVSGIGTEGDRRPERRSESRSRAEDGISRSVMGDAAASGVAPGDSPVSAGQARTGGGNPEWQANPLFGIPATGGSGGAGRQAPTPSARGTSGNEELESEDGPEEYFGPRASWDDWDERYRQQLLSTGNGAARDFTQIDRALDSCVYHRSSLPPAPSSSNGLSGFFVGRDADPLEGRRGPPRDSTGRPFRPSPSSKASESTAAQRRPSFGASGDEASSEQFAEGGRDETNEPATDSARLQELEAEMERVEAALAKMRGSPGEESDHSGNNEVGGRVVGGKTELQFTRSNEGERGTDEVVAKAQRKIVAEEPGVGRTGAAGLGPGSMIGERAPLALGLVSGEATEESNDDVTWGVHAAGRAGKASQAGGPDAETPAGVNRLPYKLPSGKKGLPKSPLSGSAFGALSVRRQADRCTGSAGASAEGGSGKWGPATPAREKSEEHDGLTGGIAAGSVGSQPGWAEGAAVGTGDCGAGEAEGAGEPEGAGVNGIQGPGAEAENAKDGEGTAGTDTDGLGKGQ